MLRFIRRAIREPLWIIGPLWPFVLLAPYISGLPRPAFGGMPWRQELLIALLLSATSCALLVRRCWSAPPAQLTVRRSELFVLLPLIPFVLWNGLSALWAAHPYSGIYGALQWSAYLLFFALMLGVTARPRILRASLFALGVVVMILSIVCAIEFLAGVVPNGREAQPLLRRFSGFSEPLAVVIPLFMALALYVRNSRRAWLCGATALVAWLATLQALQRAPIIGATAGLLLLAAGVVMLRAGLPRWSPRRAVLLLTVFVIATALQFALSSRIGGGDSAIARLQSASAEDTVSTNVRLLYWNIGLEMAREHPLTGVGANNYQVVYPEARALYSARNANHPGINLNEAKLSQYAHNEYIQVLAELGLIGFLLLALFFAGLAFVFVRAVRPGSRLALPALGAGGGMLAFALSSGASAFSFRWTSSGLLFFFVAAIVTRCASSGESHDEARVVMPTGTLAARAASVCALVLAVAILYGASAQAINVMSRGLARAGASREQSEALYRASLGWNPYDPAAHYEYGLWLYGNMRPDEAIAHLRYGVAGGFNAVSCYASLAAAQAAAGDLAGAERTTAEAARIYPRSVFARVRHAAALAEIAKFEEAEREFTAALSINAGAARGWQQLMSDDTGEMVLMMQAGSETSEIDLPGQLAPEDCVRIVLVESRIRACLEEERRQLAAKVGGRAAASSATPTNVESSGKSSH
jgi:O-antigen ligase